MQTEETTRQNPRPRPPMTPGRWRVSEWDPGTVVGPETFRADGVPIAPNVAAVFPRTPGALGNAALIAAAPALLDAVEAALPVLAYASEQGGGPMDARAQDARRLAKLALAGLEGGAR